MDISGEVSKFYSEGFAVREVAAKLGISIDRVYKLMRKKNIPRRSCVEANRLAYIRKPATFKPVLIENQEQEILKAIGVMLYWAEGAKSGCSVDFANSDERMIKLFLRFLRGVCGVLEEKLRVYLYCYPQHENDVRSLIEYWSKVTGINSAQFTKPYIRRNAGGKVGQKLQHGLIHVRYNDKKLLIQLLKWVDEWCERFHL